MKLATRISVFLIVTLLAAVPFTSMPSQAATDGTAYIIVFKDSVVADTTAQALTQAYGLQAGFQTVPTGIQRIFADTNANIDIDGTDDFRVDVDVAVIDTGVDFQHPDLNVVGGVNCAGGSPFGQLHAGGDDDHYHGTHVAGTIAAIDNGIGVVGVAPGARLWAVKVLNSRAAATPPGSSPASTGWPPTRPPSRSPT
jgi:subtilisin family serine protease